ncbi:MAG: LON peptidase substrate-binding domain-containing protein, partial [Armatimonadota bacterium]
MPNSTAPNPANTEESGTTLPIPNVLGLLPLRDAVVFPGEVRPVHVITERLINMVSDTVAKGNRFVAVSAVANTAVAEPLFEDVYPVGTVGYIRAMVKLPDGIRMLVQGVQRIRLLEPVQQQPYITVKIELIETPSPQSQPEEVEAARRLVGNLFARMVSLSTEMDKHLASAGDAIRSPDALADFVAANSPLSTADKQDL